MRSSMNHRTSYLLLGLSESVGVKRRGGGGGGGVPLSFFQSDDDSVVGGGGGGEGWVEARGEFVNFTNLLSNLSDFNYDGGGGNGTDTQQLSFGWTDFALLLLYCSVIAGTVIGNILVIASVATTRRLRTITNCFVMSLSVADFMVGCFVMPLKLVQFVTQDNAWHLGRVICVLWISLDILLCTASILSLCAISIDRYLAITRPLAYSRKRRSKRLALSMISCVWVAAVIITSPPIFGWYDSERNGDLTCEYNDDTGYVVYSALGSFFLPLLVMLYVYARIALVIARRQKTIEKLHIQTQKKFCEDQDGVKDETTSRVLDSLDEHNRVERSSSSSASASHAIVASNSPPPRVVKETGLWRRLRFCSGPQPVDNPVSKTERTPTTIDYHGGSRDLSRSNTFGKRSCGSGRTRTGSRLCHHMISVSALSPQRSIHRAHKSSSSSANIISLSDGDLSHGGGGENNSKRDASSRIWTIDCNEQSSNKLNGRHRNCSTEILAYEDGRLIEHSLTELHSRVYPTHHHHHGSGGGGGGSGGDARGGGQSQSRELSVGGGGNTGKVQSLSVQRRSIKSNISLRVSSPAPHPDQNQNSAAAREFTSGRMASFKRETKTAQTLAAVVGCFILCWLPFFLAYVLSPFTKIPIPLMNGLIWLGWGNSAINPFIYAFYSPDFRSAFWRLTFHKCESLFKKRGGGNSPRRCYDDPNIGVRST